MNALEKPLYLRNSVLNFFLSTWLDVVSCVPAKDMHCLFAGNQQELLPFNEIPKSMFRISLFESGLSNSQMLDWVNSNLQLSLPFELLFFDQPIENVLAQSPNLTSFFELQETAVVSIHQSPTYELLQIFKHPDVIPPESTPTDISIVEERLHFGTRTPILAKQTKGITLCFSFLRPHPEKDPVMVEFPVWIAEEKHHHTLLMHIMAKLLIEHQTLKQDYFIKKAERYRKRSRNL